MVHPVVCAGADSSADMSTEFNQLLQPDWWILKTSATNRIPNSPQKKAR